ncbi:MAG: VOC family protein [Cyclobacteriaceae bacterium]
MKIPILNIGALLCILSGCVSGDSSDRVKVTGQIEPALLAMSVKDLDISTKWYTENLGFSLDTTMLFPDYGLKINLLALDQFRLELIAFDDPIIVDLVMLPTEHSNIHGFIKFGFLTKNLEAIVSRMETTNAEIVAGPAQLPALSSGEPWPERFFLVEDPDGNYIQFFAGEESFLNSFSFSGSFSLTPFLAMISVEDFEGTRRWYEDLGFNYIEGVDTRGNQRGLLSVGNFILEIGSFKDDVSIDQLNISDKEKNNMVRLNKLAFNIDYTDSLYRKLKVENYQFFYENMEGDEPGFIIEDNERNYLQFFKNREKN